MWPDIFRKMKASGLNAVESYGTHPLNFAISPWAGAQCFGTTMWQHWTPGTALTTQAVAT